MNAEAGRVSGNLQLCQSQTITEVELPQVVARRGRNLTAGMETMPQMRHSILNSGFGPSATFNAQV